MSLAKQVFRQRDFSAGEIDEHGKRRDDSEMMRAGGRQMSNKRILATGALDQRPGRKALFAQDGRTDEVKLTNSVIYRLCFGAGTLIVRDSAGTILLNSGSHPWTITTASKIVWDLFDEVVIICFPLMRPITLTHAAGVWTEGVYTARVMPDGQKRVPFHRFAARGITLTPGGITGTVSIVFSAPVMTTAAWVGTYIRYNGRQMEIATRTDSQNGTAIVREKLFFGSTLTFGSDPADQFSIGDVVEGGETATKGEVASFSGNTMTVARLTHKTFRSAGENINGPHGALEATSSNNTVSPPALATWDEEVMNDMRGWPRSVSVDQNRIILTDFQAIPRGIAWSAIDLYDDLYPGALGEHAIFELVPGAVRVFHVMPGADEFVFTSGGIFYIPITEANPLMPGSIAFRQITWDPVSIIRPAVMSEGVLFIPAGRDKVVAIRATGQTAKPYVPAEISEFHSHLLTGPVALVASSGVPAFPDRCVMVLNGDGTVAVGRFDAGKEWVGWLPWLSGAGGDCEWISASANSILLTTRYTINAVERRIAEAVDAVAMLDCEIEYNNPPAALDGGGALGPLWFAANGIVHLMEGTRPLDTRAVDANGFLVPVEGEDLSGDIIAGFAWTEIFEPFVPHAAEGRSGKQTLRKRKFGKIAVTATHATGFVCANRRVPAWRTGDSRDDPPLLREETRFFKKAGRALDPRVDLLKDVPGPMRLIEFGGEITV